MTLLPLAFGRTQILKQRRGSSTAFGSNRVCSVQMTRFFGSGTATSRSFGRCLRLVGYRTTVALRVWICGHNYPTPQLHFPFLCNKLVLDVISNIYLIDGRFNNSRLVDGNNVGHQDFFFCVVISFRLPTERVRLETFRLPSRSVAHVPELYIERKLTFTYIPVSVFRRRVYGFS